MYPIPSAIMSFDKLYLYKGKLRQHLRVDTFYAHTYNILQRNPLFKIIPILATVPICLQNAFFAYLRPCRW